MFMGIVRPIETKSRVIDIHLVSIGRIFPWRGGGCPRSVKSSKTFVATLIGDHVLFTIQVRSILLYTHTDYTYYKKYSPKWKPFSLSGSPSSLWSFAVFSAIESDILLLSVNPSSANLLSNVVIGPRSKSTPMLPMKNINEEYYWRMNNVNEEYCFII